MAKRYDKLKLFGPRNQDDLILMYMVANGKIDIPTLAWNTSRMGTNDKDVIKRGLLNVNSWVSSAQSDTKKLNEAGSLWRPIHDTITNLNYSTPNGLSGFQQAYSPMLVAK